DMSAKLGSAAAGRRRLRLPVLCVLAAVSGLLQKGTAWVGQRTIPGVGRAVPEGLRSRSLTVRYGAENFFERFARVAKANVGK
ncbi:unnamed protein product, partial [Polarella glacialis]